MVTFKLKAMNYRVKMQEFPNGIFVLQPEELHDSSVNRDHTHVFNFVDKAMLTATVLSEWSSRYYGEHHKKPTITSVLNVGEVNSPKYLVITS